MVPGGLYDYKPHRATTN